MDVPHVCVCVAIHGTTFVFASGHAKGTLVMHSNRCPRAFNRTLRRRRRHEGPWLRFLSVPKWALLLLVPVTVPHASGTSRTSAGSRGYRSGLIS